MSNKLSQNLRRLRSQRGITQKELARLLCRSAGTISNYENGTHEPDHDTLSLLADFYGVSTDYLLGRTPLPSPAAMDCLSIGGYPSERLLALLPLLTDGDKAALAHLLSAFEALRGADTGHRHRAR